MHYTGHHIHTLWQQHLEFMTLHALYSVHHTHYIWQLLSSVWCHIHSMWYIKQWLYLWYQTPYIHDIFTLYGITHSVMTTHHCVPSQPVCLILHSKYFWHYTKCSNFMTRSECKSSQPLYVWHPMHYIWHHIHSLWLHAIVVITLHPLDSGHHTPNIGYNTYGNTNVISAICPTISNTTSTVSVSSNPGYQLYHTHSLYSITHYTCDIIFSMPAITTTV